MEEIHDLGSEPQIVSSECGSLEQNLAKTPDKNPPSEKRKETQDIGNEEELPAFMRTILGKLDELLTNRLEKQDQKIEGKMTENREIMEQMLTDRLEKQDQMIEKKIAENISGLQSGVKSQLEELKTTMEQGIGNLEKKFDNKLELWASAVNNEIISHKERVEKRISETSEHVAQIGQRLERELMTQERNREKDKEELTQKVSNHTERMAEIDENVASLRCEINTLNDKYESVEQNINRRIESIVNTYKNTTGMSGETSQTNQSRPTSTTGISSPNVPNAIVDNHACNSNEQAHLHTPRSHFTLTDISMPKFGNGPNENPLQYINELENFFVLRGVPDHAKLMVIKNSLSEHCLTWFDMTVEVDCDYRTFRTLFLEQYWDVTRQNEIRRKIMSGSYNPKKDGTMTDYLLRTAQLSKLLDPPIPVPELISMIASHFTNDIRNALIISRPTSIKEMMALLKELQVGVSHQSYRAQYSKEDKNPREPQSKAEVNFLSSGAGAQPVNNLNQRRMTPPPPDREFMIEPRRNDRSPPSNRPNTRRRPNWEGTGNRNHNNNNNYNNPWPQRNPRINFMRVENRNQNRIPPWIQRRQRNQGYWRPRDYFRRYLPYNRNGNAGRDNRVIDDYNEIPNRNQAGNHGATRNEPVNELINRQNARRDESVRPPGRREPDLNDPTATSSALISP